MKLKKHVLLLSRVLLECGKMESDVTTLIVHGWESTPGEWPWHALLYTLEAGNWSYSCGGSLISENVVLTGKIIYLPLMPRSDSTI